MKPATAAEHPSRRAPLCCNCRHDVMGFCNHPSAPVDTSVGTPLWSHAYARADSPGRCGPHGVHFLARAEHT